MSLFSIENLVALACWPAINHHHILNTTVQWHVRVLFQQSCHLQYHSKLFFFKLSYSSAGTPFILVMISSSVKFSNVGSLTTRLNHKLCTMLVLFDCVSTASPEKVGGKKWLTALAYLYPHAFHTDLRDSVRTV